jgi:hypothetical protein
MKSPIISNSSSTGMTLIETVLYIALFGIIFYSMVQFALSVSENDRDARSRNEVYRGLLFVTEHIEEALDSVDGIDVSGSVFDSNSGVLALQRGGVAAAQYQLLDTRLAYIESGTTYYITPTELAVKKFYLQRINDKVGNAVGVRIECTLRDEKSDVQSSIVTGYTL